MSFKSLPRPTKVGGAAPFVLGMLLWTISGVAEAQSVRDLLRGWLTGTGGLSPVLADSPRRTMWQGLYKERQYTPFWFDEGKPGQRLPDAIAALEGLRGHGLNLAKADRALIEQLRDLGEATLAPGKAAELELSLTDRLFLAAAELATGQTLPSEMDGNWYIDPPPFDPKPLIAGLKKGEPLPALLDKFAPQSVLYQRLRKALADLREQAEIGEWGEVPEGPTLRPGEENEAVAALRERLIKSDDLQAAETLDNPNLFDPVLEAAVLRFQGRHGLEQDAAVGPRTRANLNMTPERRIAQLRVALERLRWLPREESRHYVLVNTGGFWLVVHRPGEENLEMRVIVGQASKKWSTPSFSTKVRQVELNPYWNIPDSILREEILEGTRKDPNYLERKNIRAIGSDGEQLELTAEQLQEDIAAGTVDYRLRQDYGSGNALGRIKLLIPNRFGIYLHDTSRPKLFQRTYRALSHGCIRLEKPYDLAAAALGGDWSADKLAETAAGGARRTLQPKDSLPVRVAYFSAWVDADGTIQFREDYYNRDGRLLAAFAEPASQ